MKLYETNFGIRFILSWNGSRIPFLKKNLKICEMEFVFRFRKVWNGFQIPFHKKKTWKLYETNSRICFILFWNGSCYPFRYFLAFFLQNGFPHPFLKLFSFFCSNPLSRSLNPSFPYFRDWNFDFSPHLLPKVPYPILNPLCYHYRHHYHRSFENFGFLILPCWLF